MYKIAKIADKFVNHLSLIIRLLYTYDRCQGCLAIIRRWIYTFIFKLLGEQ